MPTAKPPWIREIGHNERMREDGQQLRSFQFVFWPRDDNAG